MRALCGAIITAGGLVGLGLLGVGFGQRYANYNALDGEGHPQWVLVKNMDAAMLVCLAVLLAGVVIGLGVAFVGLAYHHHHRTHELQHLRRQLNPPGSPTERVGT